MKRCPICKTEKDLSEFDTYFSKERNKYRPQNYCRECSKEEKRLRSKKYFENHRAARLLYAKSYRENNKTIIKERKKHYKKRYVEQLKACYVRELLVTRNNVPLAFIEENPEIIETKRMELKIKRKLKSIHNGKK